MKILDITELTTDTDYFELDKDNVISIMAMPNMLIVYYEDGKLSSISPTSVKKIVYETREYVTDDCEVDERGIVTEPYDASF